MTILCEIDRPDGIVPVTPEAVAELVAEIRRLRAVIDSHHEFFEGAKANLNDARNLIATLRAELREAGLLR